MSSGDVATGARRAMTVRNSGIAKNRTILDAPNARRGFRRPTGPALCWSSD